MTRRFVAVAVLGAAVALVSIQNASAFGGRNRGGCDSGCDTPCNVTYEDKKVTAYKAEWKTKKVEVEVCEYKYTDEKYKYFVCEPVKSKQKVKVCQYTEKKEPYKYFVNTLVDSKEKVKVCEYEKVTTKAKKIVCETVCVQVQVPCDSGCGKREGLLARLCHKKNDCNDPCAKPACETPCEPKMKTVTQKQ